MYRRQMIAHGEMVTLRRNGSSDVVVRAHPSQPVVADLPGSSQQSRRTIIVLAEDVERAGFALPFVAKSDRVVWAGRVLPIMSVDDAKRRVAGVVIAYELEVAGA
jgi:hypothetical protein